MSINALEEKLMAVARQRKLYMLALENEKNPQKQQELIDKIDEISKDEKEILQTEGLIEI